MMPPFHLNAETKKRNEVKLFPFQDPGSIPGGAALFFRLIQLSVHIFVGEENKEFDFMQRFRHKRIFDLNKKR